VSALRRTLERIEDAMMTLACVAILAIVCITAADVTSRKLLAAPFAWSHDLITQYLLVAAFFLSLPYVTRISGHMSLDYLARQVTSPAARNMLSIVGEVLAIVLIAGFIYGSWNATLAAVGDVLPGDLALPTWPSRLLGPIGGTVLLLRLLLRLADTLGGLRSGRLAPHIDARAH
jgi:TRAP-type C4-dicarboxylate transport system permease small subunit